MIVRIDCDAEAAHIAGIMTNAASHLLPRRSKSERLWLLVSGPEDMDEHEAKRLSLDISAKDFEFLERLAEYRNVLARVRAKRLKRQWSRKSLAESFVAIQCAAARDELREMIEAVGDIPPADDIETLEKYVRKVLAWDKRNNDE